MKCFGTLISILLLCSSSAFGDAYRCTDAQGKVSYTNTECQAGTDQKDVKDQANLIDYSKERQFAERELARARAKANGFGELNPAKTSLFIVLLLAICAGIWAWWSRKN